MKVSVQLGEGGGNVEEGDHPQPARGVLWMGYYGLNSPAWGKKGVAWCFIQKTTL